MRSAKKIVSLILAILLMAPALTLGASAAGATDPFSYFIPVANYTDGMFYDVSSYDWYAANVATAYQFGLTSGMDDGSFGAGTNMTVAQAITFACRLYKTYYNEKQLSLTSSFGYDHWYDSYVAYAMYYDIISYSDFDDYERPVNRGEFARILSRAFRDDDALTPINSFTSIPDVSPNASYFGAVLRLYNAGVTIGRGDFYFYPDDSIVRSEAIAIVTRMAFPELRIKVDDPLPSPVQPSTVYEYLTQTAMSKSALSSGGYYRYRYYSEVSDPYTYSYLLYYYPDDQRVSLDVFISDDTLATQFWVYIPADMATPYRAGGYIFPDASDDDDYFTGFLNVDPAAFTGEGTAYFDNSSGNEDYRESLSRLFPLALSVALAEAAQRLLIPGGYTLADLGFTGGGQSVDPTSVTLNSTSRSISAGETFSLFAIVYPENASQAISWSTSNASVATVDVNGVVTGVAGGTAVITATTVNGLTATCTVTVTRPTQDAFSFLADMIPSRGVRDSAGDYYYDYVPNESVDGSGFSSDFFTYYMPERDELRVYRIVEFDAGYELWSGIVIPRDVSQPCQVYIVMEVSDSESYIGIVNLNRAAYSGGTISAFDSYTATGDRDMESSLLGVFGAMCAQSLQVAEEQMLLPNGYSLRDLGFLNL